MVSFSKRICSDLITFLREFTDTDFDYISTNPCTLKSQIEVMKNYVWILFSLAELNCSWRNLFDDFTINLNKKTSETESLNLNEKIYLSWENIRDWNFIFIQFHIDSNPIQNKESSINCNVTYSHCILMEMMMMMMMNISSSLNYFPSR